MPRLHGVERARAEGEAQLPARRKLRLGLRAHEDQRLRDGALRRLLDALRSDAGRGVGTRGAAAHSLQPGVVRPQQIVRQQSTLLRHEPTLPQRLHQPVPLLLLQDNSILLTPAAWRRGYASLGRRPRAHNPGLQHVLLHESPARQRRLQELLKRETLRWRRRSS